MLLNIIQRVSHITVLQLWFCILVHGFCMIKNIKHQVHQRHINIGSRKQTVRRSVQIDQFPNLFVNPLVRTEPVIKMRRKQHSMKKRDRKDPVIFKNNR